MDLAAIPLFAAPRQHVRHERRQIRAVRPHAALRRFPLDTRRAEQPLRRRVHEDDVPFLIRDQDGVRDRVDDQIEAVPLVAHLRLGHAQRAVAFLDFFLRAREVGDVSQNRNDVGPLPLVLRARAQKLDGAQLPLDAGVAS